MRIFLAAVLLAASGLTAQADPKYALRTTDCDGPKCEDSNVGAQITKAQCEMVLKAFLDANPANPRHFRCKVSDEAVYAVIAKVCSVHGKCHSEAYLTDISQEVCELAKGGPFKLPPGERVTEAHCVYYYKDQAGHAVTERQHDVSVKEFSALTPSNTLAPNAPITASQPPVPSSGTEMFDLLTKKGW